MKDLVNHIHFGGFTPVPFEAPLATRGEQGEPFEAQGKLKRRPPKEKDFFSSLSERGTTQNGLLCLSGLHGNQGGHLEDHGQN